ncbi:MAG TPA: hypothetical protein VIF09_09315 [Polyangiaceae bacterium]
MRQASLVLFRAAPDQPGGGLLGLEVDLGVEPAKIDAAKAEIARFGTDPPEIVLPDWLDGTAYLIGPLAGPGAGDAAARMFVAQLAATTPSLVGNDVAVFSVRADEDGASLLAQTIAGGSIPAGVTYDLATLGLMGALGIRVDVDLRGAYDRVAFEIAATSRYGHAAFQKTVEGMITDHVMNVVVLDGSGGDSARADAIVQATEELAMRLLQPTLSPVAFGPGAPKAQYLDLGFTLRVERDQLETSASFTYTERRARRVAHRPQGSLAGLLDGVDPKTIVREVSGSDPFFASTSVLFELAGGLGPAGMSALSVRAEWGVPANAPEGTPAQASGEALLDPATGQATLAAGVSGAMPYRWRGHATYLASADASPERTSSWRDATGEHQYFEPALLFPTRALSVVAGRIDFSWIARAEVELVRGADTLTTVLDGATLATTFRLDNGPATPTLAATFHGIDGEPTWTTAAAPVTGDVVMVDAPFADSLAIVVIPVPTSATLSITVDLVREEKDSGFRHERSVSFAPPDWFLQRAVLRRLDGASSAFTYTVTLVDDRGVTTQGPFTTSAPAIAVGDATREPRRVELLLVHGGPATTGDLSVEATVTPVDASGAATGAPATHVFQGQETQAEVWTTAPHDTPTRFATHVQRLTAAGQTKTTDAVSVASTIVLDG